MFKRMFFLTSIVLVLSLSSAVQGQGTIELDNYSFELADEVNLVTCHGGLDGVWAWRGGGESTSTMWTGVDVNCGVAGMCADCRDWLVFTDGNSHLYFDTGTWAYQLSDHNITAGYKYTITLDSMTWWSPEGHTQPMDVTFYYVADDDPCGPDTDHLDLSTTRHIVTGYEVDCPLGPDNCLDDWEYDLESTFVAETGAAYIGHKLGIKFASAWSGDYPGSSYGWVDNVRAGWEWATIAYDPNPGDNAVLVSKNTDLTWKPGLWAAATGGHEVYLGTDETAVANADSTDTTGIYRTTQDTNSRTPTESPLVLGETYYWKITELNSGYVGPVTPPWEGDVWSFRIEGAAYDPIPRDGETDVVFLGLELEWTAGTDAQDHVVYFGSDEQAVADATTSSPECKGPQTAADTNYAIVDQLGVGEPYYWRIDEKSSGGSHIIKGDVWSFLVGQFLIVDDFEDYNNTTEAYDVWDDLWVNSSDGELFLETEPNFVRQPGTNPTAIEFLYDNDTYVNWPQDPNLIGSWFDVQDMAELDIGSDWTVGGVKALKLHLRGDPDAVLPTVGGGRFPPEDFNSARPWVELEDTSNNVGFVAHPQPAAIVKSINWREWDIDLALFDACGVVLSAIDRFTIGIGGLKVGQAVKATKANYLYFDDIRLYPPVCNAKKAPLLGDFTGDGEGDDGYEPDCNVDFWDVNLMARDWLIRDGCFPTTVQHAVMTEWADTTSQWVTGHIGSGALEFVQDTADMNNRVDMNEPQLVGLTHMSITAWVKRNGDQSWVGIVNSREGGPDDNDATELAFGGKGWGGVGDNALAYCWNEIKATWQYDAGLDVPDATWTFVAMAVDPCGCTLYMKPEGSALEIGAKHLIPHPPLINFNHVGFLGRGGPDKGFFKGVLDDVRIYDYDLDAWEMLYLASQGTDPDGNEPDPNCPVFWWKFDDGSGLVATDDGCGTVVYRPVMSKANLTDPEPVNSRFLNFLDYEIMADNWMGQLLWPTW